MADIQRIKQQLSSTTGQLQDKAQEYSTKVTESDAYHGVQRAVSRHGQLQKERPVLGLFVSVQALLFAVPIAIFLMVIGTAITGIAVIAGFWIFAIIAVALTILLATLSVLFFIGLTISAWILSMVLFVKGVQSIRDRGLQATLNSVESYIRSFSQQGGEHFNRAANKSQDAVVSVKEEAKELGDKAKKTADEATEKTQDVAQQGQKKAEEVKDEGKKQATDAKEQGEKKVDRIKKEADNKAAASA